MVAIWGKSSGGFGSCDAWSKMVMAVMMGGRWLVMMAMAKQWPRIFGDQPLVIGGEW